MVVLPIVETLLGVGLIGAGFAYAIRLRKGGGVAAPSRPFWILCLSIGLGAGLVSAGVISLL